MATKLRGRWALGITPRHFTWILKDKLAICERPGGYGDNHRRVRRQEEIIWIRENGFGCVISIIPAPHNLHNYEELGVSRTRHRPFNGRRPDAWLRGFYREIARAAQERHQGDRPRRGGRRPHRGDHGRLHPLGRPRRRRHGRRSRSPSASPVASSTRSPATSSSAPPACAERRLAAHSPGIARPSH